jgi:hypothetical protein
LTGLVLASTVLGAAPPLQAQNPPQASPAVVYNAAGDAPESVRLETFRIVWETVRDRYCDPTFGGIDWAAARERYRPLVLMTPKSRSLKGVGVVPDVAVELRRADLLAGKDSVIENAIGLLTKDAAQVTFASNGQQIDNLVGRGVALADFHGDRALDAFVLNESVSSAESVRVYFGDGRGQFADSGQRLLGPFMSRPFVHDIDGNGKPDVITGRTVWINDGRGTFTDSALRLGTEWSWELAVGDINRDGRPDVFVVNPGVDRSAPPESMMKGRFADIWLNTTLKARRPLRPPGSNRFGRTRLRTVPRGRTRCSCEAA